MRTALKNTNIQPNEINVSNVCCIQALAVCMHRVSSCFAISRDADVEPKPELVSLDVPYLSSEMDLEP